ncbi:cytochrome P450 82A4-like [Gastrolobium bilobum]|uniref:cytochrome P450 82A4-like n=1 Tax=Gastrolobium bilobum TaxID=150636 RepID=UPI002AAFE0CE|nr:cytochrome P450 82A4-like [Gastrolobium bilobum]
MDLVLNYLNTTIIGLLSLIILRLFILCRPSKVDHSREAPIVEGAWPIFGHLPLMLSGSNSTTPHRTLGAMADKCGPLFTIKLGSTPTLVLSNWEMAKECFTTNDMAVSSRPKLVAVEHMSYNQAVFSFAPYGPYWRELRKVATLEIFSSRRVDQLRDFRVLEVQTSIKELFNVWCKRRNECNYVLVDMKQWFFQLTFNMVLRMAVRKRYFGDETGVDENEGQRCIKALREFMRLTGEFTVGDAIPYLRWFDFGGHEKAMKETAKEFDRILGEWLEEHCKNRTLDEKVDRDQDLMDVMLSVFDGTTIDEFDTNTVIKATIWTLIVGGTDTSSVTLTWALSLILRNPLILEKAKAELDTQVGKERSVSESDISKLVYLQAIVKETLRLYPPAPLSGPREFINNCTLGGYDVKKGTRLITNLWKIHTDPNVWSDPMEFKPERFLTTHKDIDVRGHHFELLPFGSGRRMCPGISFGLHIVHLTLASFLHSFEILNPSSEPIDMTESFGLSNVKASPLEIMVKPRLSPNCYETM